MHLNGPGLLYNYDLTTFGRKVIRDVADSQQPDGMVPTTAPRYVIFEGPGMDPFAESPEWASTLILFPFMYYEAYGDDSLIREYYPYMRRYVDYLTSRADGHIVDFGLGDWYDYDGIHKAGFSRNTSIAIVATAHYYMDLCKLVEAARMVGNAYDAATYGALADEVKQHSTPVSSTQTPTSTIPAASVPTPWHSSWTWCLPTVGRRCSTTW